MSLDYCAAHWRPFLLLTELPRSWRTTLSAVPLMIVIVALWLLGREELWHSPPSSRSTLVRSSSESTIVL